MDSSWGRIILHKFPFVRYFYFKWDMRCRLLGKLGTRFTLQQLDDCWGVCSAHRHVSIYTSPLSCTCVN
jgi:hypothetical protein